MATRIPQRELRNNNAEILNRIEAGESFIVTRRGVAVADVIPHAERGTPPKFPKTEDLVARRQAAQGPAPEREAWLSDIRDLERLVSDDPLDRDA